MVQLRLTTLAHSCRTPVDSTSNLRSAVLSYYASWPRRNPIFPDFTFSRCYAISALGDSLKRSRVSSVLKAAFLSISPGPSRLLFARLPCRLPFRNWITRTIVYFCLNIRPRPRCGCHANAESYPRFLDDCVSRTETNSATMHRDRVCVCVLIMAASFQLCL